VSAERLKIGQPRFLTLVEVLDAHEIAIARHGGASGVRDQGSLESALAMAEQSFGGDDAAQAVLDLVTNKLDKGGFAEWLHRQSAARPSLELRDFFGRVTGDKFVEFFQHTRPDALGQENFQREMDEAVATMPAIHYLLNINKAATASADDATRLTSTTAILTLVAIQRLAEDMGYEW
jgi:hypothetical protein